MFKSLTYLKYENGFCYYRLMDDDFECDVTAAAGAAAAAAVIQEYQKRNLPVAKNSALYYLWLREQGHNANFCLTDYHLQYLTKYYPELKYKEKYYPCVKRHYDNLVASKDLG